MKRIDAPGATPENLFTEGNPGTGTPATDIAADWLNSVQEEICSVVEAAGIALNGAVVNQLLTAIRTMQYPVGSIYITARTDMTAFQLLGFGTWVQIGVGRCLVARDPAQAEFATVGQQGGAKTHTLTEAQMPAHRHFAANTDSAPNSPVDAASQIARTDNNGGDLDYQLSGTATEATVGRTSSVGSGQAHNNLPPYEVVGAFWRRTA